MKFVCDRNDVNCMQSILSTICNKISYDMFVIFLFSLPAIGECFESREPSCIQEGL